MGDGAIVEFGSVVDAVACAVAIQKAVAEHQADVPAERRIVFRIGINLGDVVVEGDDLLGDGVNIAARLEQLCEPGGVLVSGTAFDQLQGKLGLPLEFTGEQRVKNIERPVRAYRVRLDGKAARRGRCRGSAGARWRRPSQPACSWRGACRMVVAGRHARRADRPVVAVLPFAVAGGPDPRVLASSPMGLPTGIMDELSISRIWTVMGRGASFAYRDRPNATRDLGEEQGAAFVVEGTSAA